ncbi:MAG: DUF4093 domain-containing protein [Clostridia bacterium]|nr:DUF4093 domain-containing protein [Clostridia bacterium]
MTEKLKIPYPIIVEGKYDRQRLLDVVDAQILTTDGFGIFNKKEKLALIRRLSEKTKIIVLSDSDGAGKLIRAHISSAIPTDRLIQLYVPRIEGKEHRKAEPSKEGVLGVEGMDSELLYKLLSPFTDDRAVRAAEGNQLSKTDFYIDGLLGGENSTEKRDRLALAFGLPSGMTANALLSALRILVSYDEYRRAVDRLK